MGSKGPKMGSKELAAAMEAGPRRHIVKARRNEPCPCGSSQKYKDCHAGDGTAFLEKLAKQQDRERMKADGVPWYRRWFLGA